MKKIAMALIVTAGSIAAIPQAIAAAATDALTTCVTDSTTGKDRKDLAQWIFVAMSAHPDMQPLSKVTDDKRDEMNKKMAAMVTRILAESCNAEAKAAIATDGPTSFEASFKVLGGLAMQELMTNPSVKSAFDQYSKYLDSAKFEAAFSKK
jgi:hypothetical protein